MSEVDAQRHYHAETAACVLGPPKDHGSAVSEMCGVAKKGVIIPVSDAFRQGRTLFINTVALGGPNLYREAPHLTVCATR